MKKSRRTGIDELKDIRRITQKGKCKSSGKILPDHNTLVDIHRLKPKRHGGIYEPDNVEVDLPVEHLLIHDNIALWRSIELEELKMLLERRNVFMQTRMAISNRIMAVKRNTDKETPETIEMFNNILKSALEQEKEAEKLVIKKFRSINHPMKDAAKGVKGLGELTLAQLLVNINPIKATTASKVWAYVGLDKPSYDRYTKGVTSGGNKKLRSALYCMAESMIKHKSSYTEVYYRTKDSLSISLNVVKTRNTQGNLITCAWKDTKPSHRHGAAIRKMIKHFLADFWHVYRTIEGLPTRSLWIEDRGHTGIIRPEERGWKYPDATVKELEAA